MWCSSRPGHVTQPPGRCPRQPTHSTGRSPSAASSVTDELGPEDLRPTAAPTRAGQYRQHMRRCTRVWAALGGQARGESVCKSRRSTDPSDSHPNSTSAITERRELEARQERTQGYSPGPSPGDQGWAVGLPRAAGRSVDSGHLPLREPLSNGQAPPTGLEPVTVRLRGGTFRWLSRECGLYGLTWGIWLFQAAGPFPGFL